MLNLTGNQRVRITTETICNVWASYVDKDSSTFTPDNNDGTATTAATIVTIVDEPTGSIVRNVKSINIQETTGAKCTVEVIVYDGVDTFEIFNGTLGAFGRLTLDDDGNWTVTQGYSISQTIYLTGSGTYTVPDGVGSIYVECVGGGGGGGGCLDAATNSAAAGGGGAGAYVAKTYQTAAGGSYAYAVGAAGGGAAAGNNTGTAGGTTTFGTLSAPGGSGGLPDTVAVIHVGGKGGAGGTSASGGDINVDGSPGETGMALAAAQAVSGRGASSAFGGGANCIKNATSVGAAASGYGAGGSGGCIISSGGDVGGGTGTIGIIVITEYR